MNSKQLIKKAQRLLNTEKLDENTRNMIVLATDQLNKSFMTQDKSLYWQSYNHLKNLINEEIEKEEHRKLYQ